MFKEFFTVTNAFEDVFAGIAPIDDVVKDAWEFQAQRPVHGRNPLKSIKLQGSPSALSSICFLDGHGLSIFNI